MDIGHDVIYTLTQLMLLFSPSHPVSVRPLVVGLPTRLCPRARAEGLNGVNGVFVGETYRV